MLHKNASSLQQKFLANPLLNNQCFSKKNYQGIPFVKAIPNSSVINYLGILPDDSMVMAINNHIEIRDRKNNKLLRVLTGHTRPVTCLAISAKKNLIISGANDHTIKIWDITTGKCIKTLQEEHRAIINCVDVLPNGNIVACLYDATLKIWDITTGKCIHRLIESSSLMGCLAILPDGKIVSARRDHSLIILDSSTGQCLKVLTGHDQSITCLAVLPDGKIVSGSKDCTVKIWDSVTGECLTLTRHFGRITSIVVLSNKNIASCSSDDTVRIWDIKTGVINSEINSKINSKEYRHKITSLAVFSDGNILGKSYRPFKSSIPNKLLIYQFPSNKLNPTLHWLVQQELQKVRDLLEIPPLSQRHRLVLQQYRNSLTWVSNEDDWLACKELKGLIFLAQHMIDSARYSNILPEFRDAILAMVEATYHIYEITGDAKLCWLHLKKNKARIFKAGEINKLTSIPDPITLLNQMPEELLILIFSNFNKRDQALVSMVCKHWHTLLQDKPLSKLCDYEKEWALKKRKTAGKISNLAISFNNKIILSVGKDIEIRNVQGKLERLLTGHAAEIDFFTILPNGYVASRACDGCVKIWDITADKNINVSTFMPSKPLFISIHSLRYFTSLSDGKIVYRNVFANDLTLYDPLTNTSKPIKNLAPDQMVCITELPSGKIVYGSVDNTIEIWDPLIEKTTQFLVLTGRIQSRHMQLISHVTALPDGKIAIGSFDGIVEIWDLAIEKLIQTFIGHVARITRITNLPDKKIVSCSADGVINIWDIITGNCLNSLKTNYQGIKNITVSRDGKIIFSSKKSLLIWQFPFMQLEPSDLQFIQEKLQKMADFLKKSQPNRLHRLALYRYQNIAYADNKEDLLAWVGLEKIITAAQDLLNIIDQFNISLKLKAAILATLDSIYQNYELSQDVDACLISLQQSKNRILKEINKTSSVTQELPQEVWMHIFSFLTKIDKAKAMLTHKSWHNIFQDKQFKNLPSVRDYSQAAAIKKIRSYSYGSNLHSLAILPNNNAAISLDKGIEIIDIKNGSLQKLLSGYSLLNCLTASDKNIVSGSEDCTVEIWDSATGKCVKTLRGHEKRITCVAILRDGKIASGSEDHTVKIWDPTTGECMLTFTAHSNGVLGVAVLPDENIVSGSEDGILIIWNPSTGNTIKTLTEPTGFLDCMAALPNGNIVSTSHNYNLTIWNPATGNSIKTLKGHISYLHCILALPDGNIASSSRDGIVNFWNTATGKCMHSFQQQDDAAITALALCNGKIIGRSRKQLLVWKFPYKKPEPEVSLFLQQELQRIDAFLKTPQLRKSFRLALLQYRDAIIHAKDKKDLIVLCKGFKELNAGIQQAMNIINKSTTSAEMKVDLLAIIDCAYQLYFHKEEATFCLANLQKNQAVVLKSYKNNKMSFFARIWPFTANAGKEMNQLRVRI